MAKRKAAPRGASPSAALAALTFAEAVSMDQPAQVERFLVESMSGQRAFSSMAKIFRALQDSLVGTGQKIFPLLEDAGIKKGTISSASTAAKVFDLVLSEHLTEEEFNSLTFEDCRQIGRVMLPTSKRQLTPDEVVAVVRNKADFAEELDAYYTLGMTAEEKEAADAATKAAKEAEKAEAARRAEAEKAEAERLRQENEALKAQAAEQAAQAAAATPPPQAATPPPQAATPPPQAATPPPQAATPPPQAATPPPQAEAPESADDLIALLVEVEIAMARLPEDEQERVIAKITEMAETFATA